MTLIENYARNTVTLVRAGDSRGPGSGMASAIKVVERGTTGKECLERFGRREIEGYLSNKPPLNTRERLGMREEDEE